MATYYVATASSTPAGSNANPGTIGAPFLTFAYAFTQMAGNDTLIARAGTYTAAIANGIPTGSSVSVRTIIQAYPGETVWITPNAGPDYALLLSQTSQRFIEFDGINFNGINTTYGAVKIEAWSGGNPHHINIKNCAIIGSANDSNGIVMDAQVAGMIGGNEISNVTITGIKGLDFCHGIYIKSSNNIVEYCDISDFPGGGVHLFGSYTMNANIIRYNTIHGGFNTPPGGGGLQRHWGIIAADYSQDTQIYGNVIYGILDQNALNPGYSAAIEVFTGSDGTLVYNNTCVDNAGYGIHVTASTATNVDISNNIMYGNGIEYLDEGPSTTYTTNLEVDPGFVNAVANNYHITIDGDAYHAGTFIALVPSDKDGVAYDNPPSVGAYEFFADGGIEVSISDNTGYDFAGVQDTHINSGAATTAYGSEADLEIYKYSVVTHKTGLIRVTGLSNIPSTATIIDATLSLYMSGGAGDATLTAYRCLRDWTEAGATWNTYNGSVSWGTAGALNSSDRSATISGTVDVTDVSQFYGLTGDQFIADIQGFVDGTYTNNGWVIERTDGADDFIYHFFRSSEGTDGQRPILTVTYTEEEETTTAIFAIHFRQRRN